MTPRKKTEKQRVLDGLLNPQKAGAKATKKEQAYFEKLSGNRVKPIEVSKMKWKKRKDGTLILDFGYEVEATVSSSSEYHAKKHKGSYYFSVGDWAGEMVSGDSPTEEKAKREAEKYMKMMVRVYKKEVKKLNTIIKRVGV